LVIEMFDVGQKQWLFKNLRQALHGVPQAIIDRQMKHLDAVHPDYAAGVREALAHTSKAEEKMALHDPK
jgi:catalase